MFRYALGRVRVSGEVFVNVYNCFYRERRWNKRQEVVGMERITVGDIAKACKGRLLCGDPGAGLRHIRLDSRQVGEGDLFVPLRGARQDGHSFIPQVLRAGAGAVLTSEHSTAEGEKAWIAVEDTKEALQQIGSWFRERNPIPLVGITGSVGKTTTREMVAAALAARFRVYKTPGNYNSQVGVPVTLSEIGSEDEIGVIELGMSEPGEMCRIARIARVDQAVITNIGVAHIGQLGSQENICREKLKIQEGMREGGVLFVNGDDPFLREVKAKEGCRRISYGLGENCDFQAVDMDREEGYPVFTAWDKLRDERARVKLSVFGTHMISNAMASLAVARENGIPLKEAAAALALFHGAKGRQRIFAERKIQVIDDSYNASPVSMKAGIQVLCDIPAEGMRVAVLADMKELGPKERCYHREVGSFLAGHPVDRAVFLGELAEEIGRQAQEERRASRGEGMQGEREFVFFRDKKELTFWLKENLKPGDIVLFKGSNSMGLSAVVRELFPKAYGEPQEIG